MEQPSSKKDKEIKQLVDCLLHHLEALSDNILHPCQYNLGKKSKKNLIKNISFHINKIEIDINWTASHLEEAKNILDKIRYIHDNAK